MIKDGLFERFDMNTVWGMHNWPGMDVGKIGVIMAPVWRQRIFEIYIAGSGGHAAIPDLTIDPIPCGQRSCNPCNQLYRVVLLH